MGESGVDGSFSFTLSCIHLYIMLITARVFVCLTPGMSDRRHNGYGRRCADEMKGKERSAQVRKEKV